MKSFSISSRITVSLTGFSRLGNSVKNIGGKGNSWQKRTGGACFVSRAEAALLKCGRGSEEGDDGVGGGFSVGSRGQHSHGILNAFLLAVSLFISSRCVPPTCNICALR